MKIFVIRIRSRVDNKTYAIRVKSDNKSNARVKANDAFIIKYMDKLPADFVD